MELEALKNKEEQLLLTAQHLLINSAFTTDLGLYHGRMGIVLFLCQYARFSGNLLYEDFAGELIDMINEDLTEDMTANIENGLSGIGWGIEYLVSNRFMSGNTDDVLTDIDERIMQYDPVRIKDNSFNQGSIGILFYVLTRLNSQNRDSRYWPFDEDYLNRLYRKAENLLRDETLDSDCMQIVKSYRNTYANKQLQDQSLSLTPFLSFKETKEDELGLINGWAGKGFKLLSENGTTIYF